MERRKVYRTLNELNIQYQNAVDSARMYSKMYTLVGTRGYLLNARSSAEIAIRIKNEINSMLNQPNNKTSTIQLENVAC